MKARFRSRLTRSIPVVIALLIPVAMTQAKPWPGPFHSSKHKANGACPEEQPVGGFYANIGPTGIRADLVVRDGRKRFVVRYVFEQSPAHGRIKNGDVLKGINGKPFVEAVNGDEPLMQMGEAIDQAEGRDGRISLSVDRDGKSLDVDLRLKPIGAFSRTYPFDCRKSDAIFRDICAHLAGRQKPNGLLVGLIDTSLAGMVLMASGEKQYQQPVRQAAHAVAEGVLKMRLRDGSRSNWVNSFTGIFLAEYYLATRDPKVRTALQWLHDVMLFNYAEGGAFGHGRVEGGNPGYWSLNIVGAQCFLALSLMRECDLKFDRYGYEKTADYFEAATGDNGYVCYGEARKVNGGADGMGRSGATILAHQVTGQGGRWANYVERGGRYLFEKVGMETGIPDTHASPMIGVLWSCLGAHASSEKAHRKVMDYMRWWFTMARCHDGTFVAQPNRDSAQGDYAFMPTRIWNSSIVGLILAVKTGRLRTLGGGAYIAGVDRTALDRQGRQIYDLLSAEAYAKADQKLARLLDDKDKEGPEADGLSTADADDPVRLMRRWLDERADAAAAEVQRLADDPDVYMAKKRIDEMEAAWGGVAGFDKVLEPVQERLRQEPARSQLRLGQQYHRVLTAAERRPSASAVAALKRFAKRAGEGSFYANAAIASADEIQQRLEILREKYFEDLKNKRNR